MKASAHKRGISSGVRAVMIQAPPIPRPHDRANFQHWYSATQRILMHLGKAWVHPRGEAQLPLFTRIREDPFSKTQAPRKVKRSRGSVPQPLPHTQDKEPIPPYALQSKSPCSAWPPLVH